MNYNCQLFSQQKSWLVTGAAGFIGSNLIEFLLQNDQRVIGIDNFYSGKRENLLSVREKLGNRFHQFHFFEGDIREQSFCEKIMKTIDFVLHHAAFVSVPRSIKEPDVCYDINVCGTQNLLQAADLANVQRFIYASSSAVYGDGIELEKSEDMQLKPQSPYAQSKIQNEIDAKCKVRGKMKTMGFRYFNIFGPRQDPSSPYSGVIAIWKNGLLQQRQNLIFGDGTSTRDFCPIESVVNANISACIYDLQEQHTVLNIGTGQSFTLNEMYRLLESEYQKLNPQSNILPVQYKEFREGDILHSRADIRRAKEVLNFAPKIDLQNSIKQLLQGAIEK